MSNTSSPAARKRVDWAALGWLLLFFWYFSGVTQALILFSGTTGFAGFRDAFFLSSLWLAPPLLLPRFTKGIAAIIGLVLWGASLVGLSYFGIYKQEFSQSVIFVMFESNTAEAGEYFSQYFSLWLCLALLAYSVVAVLLWRRIRPVSMPAYARVPLAILLVALNLVYPFYKQMVTQERTFAQAVEKVQSRMEPAVPWQLVVGYVQYRQQLENMQKLLQQNASLPPLQNLKDSSGDAPRTLVLVLGESTTRQHMHLYGYGRDTTPNLDALAASGQGLTVFQNVVAPRPYTIEVMQQILTFGDEQNPDKFLTDPSLINLMKQAGYKTFWITNQQTMTKRNTMLTTFSQQTDEQAYLNNQRNQNASQYDGVVLDPFEKALKDPAQKKFIVVHLLGTHMDYRYRYPDEFAYFKDRQGAPSALSDDQVETYNFYDNAVRYNDFVVSSLIKRYSAANANGFMLYLSDHGEEVYSSGNHDRLGRNEMDPTRPMYTIPFMVWTSPSWQAEHPRDLQAVANRSYSSSHLIHTLSDLAGLSYDRFEPAKSLVNQQFAAAPRWIGDPYKKDGLHEFDKLPLDKAAQQQEIATGTKAPATAQAPVKAQPNEG
ncbi:phosphoethanolamine transferase CptA [Pseudomonas nitroreducens]|uniref:phosphoethanolamine transferase CptA n=1 Tax=Pseudomonas aeruginosa group TaxID=136841 RepID=UPI001F3B8D23|nr:MULTISPECIES: phosphoethanolamine transferase CptA [Pseudomonas aeruginosa group]MCP1648887.1 heptose-I-phosphate ethanolaminephosphotransferase [Pseudomonas nitroreducens]MCP1685152.1 heptose-I-phosphate ethanolaminephosphotransferase [Pseudomonas nitroreducens]MDG9853565.1 phosphoethanolamine transferase CptA [Pseudomonas nitroreducens]MDH1076841.1 phosphoethanolamine transferase CptA [Pseudomonas nitroreducens]